MREYSVEDNKYLIVKESGRVYKLDLDLLLPSTYVACEEVKEKKTMSKGLEALKHFKSFTHEDDYIVEGKTWKKVLVDNYLKEHYDIIEKELKALEIIKENKILGLTLEWDGTWWTVHAPNCPFPIAYGRKKEEYDLLKEVLL